MTVAYYIHIGSTVYYVFTHSSALTYTPYLVEVLITVLIDGRQCGGQLYGGRTLYRNLSQL